MNRRRLTQAERKQETRQLLIDSAIEIFAQLGFHGASVDKIADHAGFTKGAVYAHFQSKEDLFLAILEGQMQLHVSNIHHVIDHQPSLSHFIEAMDAYFMSVQQQNRTWNMLNLEFLLYAMREESVRKRWSNMIIESVQHLSKAIQTLMPKESDSTLSADEMAWTILALENGMAIFYYISGDQMPLSLYGKALQNMLSSK
ncbi:TetR/AcrR family transcriptional regulator [Brevibacillus formosus]|uniref:TetR family transcriptional regulator n=1 Tax=Brevibacillus formosus TaxID=54913 RepID=A0A837KQV2_9BACL|nr:MULTISPECIES: TetR/AcrR family transcriptional regulator [Brevibacillus]KLI00051.1 TetR family transcriptional regulator [Brevibacillus formosus]MBG9945883.1 TetR family transcriptional regulator [Brevibacillus formosus]MBW5466876.1 TetR family transcriptional regulator [Brevibacillus formosus]MED1944143.1 TetR/AcrR family transcriptional regulator [Brevibacillus formosus]MED1959363.1 TetR/AcrR family transcriptional regulator [Brevibacillus formosus]